MKDAKTVCFYLDPLIASRLMSAAFATPLREGGPVGGSLPPRSVGITCLPADFCLFFV